MEMEFKSLIFKMINDLKEKIYGIKKSIQDLDEKFTNETETVGSKKSW